MIQLLTRFLLAGLFFQPCVLLAQLRDDMLMVEVSPDVAKEFRSRHGVILFTPRFTVKNARYYVTKSPLDDSGHCTFGVKSIERSSFSEGMGSATDEIAVDPTSCESLLQTVIVPTPLLGHGH